MNERPAAYRLDGATVGGDWPIWLVLLGLFGVALWAHPHLPEQVPSHWNLRGEVDAYAPRAFGAFFIPGMALGLYVLMLVLPLVDPRRDNYPRFAGAYRLLRWGLVLFMAGLYGITLASALGAAVDVGLAVKAGVALLFLLIGNVMGQFRHNYFVGIRTPWTLASEEVWQRTHRAAGRLWVAGSLVCLATAPVRAGWGAWVFFAAILVMAVGPIVHSYLLYRALHGGQPPDG
ncbi:MAG: SdpI family protein [Syntrophomonadaceae bacterium]|jgi:uncharacterized membrane protein|nr:SdpI family protein [Syntrophomonadaceae bacterium]MDH7497788.1 SdpI family protein [Syntrophomonadaceae bacterium]